LTFSGSSVERNLKISSMWANTPWSSSLCTKKIKEKENRKHGRAERRKEENKGGKKGGKEGGRKEGRLIYDTIIVCFFNYSFETHADKFSTAFFNTAFCLLIVCCVQNPQFSHPDNKVVCSWYPLPPKGPVKYMVINIFKNAYLVNHSKLPNKMCDKYEIACAFGFQG
jgi:hypothetical protein